MSLSKRSLQTLLRVFTQSAGFVGGFDASGIGELSTQIEVFACYPLIRSFQVQKAIVLVESGGERREKAVTEWKRRQGEDIVMYMHAIKYY